MATFGSEACGGSGIGRWLSIGDGQRGDVKRFAVGDASRRKRTESQ